MKLEPEVLQMLKKIKGDYDWNFLMKKMLKSYQKKLEIEQKQHEEEEKQFQQELKQEKPEAVQSNNHAVTAAIKNYLIKRSKGRCEHPNCKKPGKHIHHTDPFALKKVHDPDKLVFLCEEHHQIIHLGYIDDGTFEPEILQLAQDYQFESIKPSKSTISWKQIDKLPGYDLKNVINQKIAEFKKSHH